MFPLCVKTQTEIFDKLKPYLNCMYLCDIKILMSHIENDTYEELCEWIADSDNQLYVEFLEKTSPMLKEYMEG